MTYKNPRFTQIVASHMEMPKEEFKEINDKIAINIEPKRLNVIVERSVYMKIKEYCVKNDISISQITRNLWLDHLKSNS